MMYNQGDIVLINIPFSDLSSYKKRPVLIVSKNEYNNKQDDVIVVAVTSNIVTKDYTVEFGNNDMKDGTIIKKSCIRADKIYTLDKKLILKKFGTVSDTVMSKIIKAINSVFNSK